MDNPAPSPKPKPGYFDIVPANKQMPTNSSRPIVVTNQPQPDPMVAAPKTAAQSLTAIPVTEAPPPVSTTPQPITVATEPAPPSVAESKPAPSVETTETPAIQAKPLDLTKLPNPVEVEMPVIEDHPKKSKNSDIVVSRHKMAGRTLHNVIEVLLILALLAVILDLILDLHMFQSLTNSLNLPHTHFFGG